MEKVKFRLIDVQTVDTTFIQSQVLESLFVDLLSKSEKQKEQRITQNSDKVRRSHHDDADLFFIPCGSQHRDLVFLEA
jgi:hypothetical protein